MLPDLGGWPLGAAGSAHAGDAKGGVKEIRNKNQWDTLLKYHKLSTGLPVIVDYYSDGCGPCRMMAPIYKSMSKEYAGRAVFTKVDVNQLMHLHSFGGAGESAGPSSGPGSPPPPKDAPPKEWEEKFV